MHELVISPESFDSSGAQALLFAAIDELERRYGQIDDDAHLSNDELSSPRGLFLVARHQGHLAGGVGLRSIIEPNQQIGEIKRLWVRPDLRRCGVAAALMSDIEDRARLMGYRQLYLETGPAQPEAIAFYPKIGWTPTDRFPEGAFTHHGATRFTKLL